MAKKTEDTDQPEVASNLPQIEKRVDEEGIPAPGDALKDADFKDGIFTHIASGEKYALCIHEKNTYERTHSLKNSAHFWQGNVASFNAEFTKS